MEKNEILIGREVEKGEFLIDKAYVSVSRKHARIIRKPEGLFIEDLDSAHGTFVNGKSVISKKINLTDKITLGGVDYYELKLDKILKLLPMSDTEFSAKFMDLKRIYDDYQAESNRLQAKGQDNMMMRMMPTMVLGSLTGIFTAVLPDSLRLIILIIGGVLTVVVFLVALKVTSNSNKKMKEKITKLNEDFELDYVCPACGVSFKGRSWEFLKRAGKCSACQRECRID